MESTRGHGSLLVPRGRRTPEDRAETATGQRSATEEGGWRRGGRGEDEGRRWRRDRRRCAALENPRAVEDPSRLTRRRNFARVLGPGPVPRRGGADRAACARPRAFNPAHGVQEDKGSSGSDPPPSRGWSSSVLFSSFFFWKRNVLSWSTEGEKRRSSCRLVVGRSPVVDVSPTNGNPKRPVSIA